MQYIPSRLIFANEVEAVFKSAFVDVQSSSSPQQKAPANEYDTMSLRVEAL